jgi:hypothetical protein
MSESGLIQDYLAVLSAQLPGPIVEELADGLRETHRHYLQQGLDPDAAARAALAEFGKPSVILADFARVNPARLTARRLLGIGPVVGACWAAALLIGRAWTWPVPILAFVLVGLALLAVIGLLAVAALGTRYRSATRAGVAGCVGIAALDVTIIIGVMLAAPSVTWEVLVAAAASAARIAFSARALRPARAG